MDPRIRRLAADHARVMERFGQGQRIRLVSADGVPPERYVFEFDVSGLIPEGEGQCRIGTTHRAEVFLPLDYPRRPPFCRMITPLFHPNVDPQKICIGDHWSAGQTLDALVIRIAEMIGYQSYNVKSPLNAKAAEWTEMNAARLPLEKTDLNGAP